MDGLNATQVEMPKYKSHKTVHALKIKSIVFDSGLAKAENRETDGSAKITPIEEGFAPFKVDHEYVRKHSPQVGGYFVVYEDGYKSWSPAGAFEEGNTLIEQTIPMEGKEVPNDHPRFKEAYSIAIVCHEANRAWCDVNGDHSQKTWNEAEKWQRESAIEGVLFRFDNPNAKEDAQHNAWMKSKVDDGWVYGTDKDAEKKTHPCIMPFNELPDFQQKKDKLFCAIVDSLKQ